MWLLPLYILVIGLLLYVTLATAYLLILAVAYFILPEPERKVQPRRLNRFAIVVPAHNEELLVPRLCESLTKIDYPSERYEIFIIADNCEDKTTEMCRPYPVCVLERNDLSRRGKGFALSWAMDCLPLEKFDAVLVVDADNVVDRNILAELNNLIEDGEKAIQCYNSVGNRSESWFTQILFVSRTISNLLYHHAKYKLGLSSYLMGNGICFTTELLRRKGWTAFTIGEDWEYYAQLIQDGIKTGFAVNAKVYHQESRSLNQATSQRLRWSSGRFKVTRSLGVKLFFQGVRRRDWFTVDASLPLIFPNYSLQINLTLLSIALCFLLPTGALTISLMSLGLGLLLGQGLLFAAGTYLAGDYWEVLKSIICVPGFLIWKLIIDLASLTGIYQGNRWVRTRRHQPR